MKRLIFLISIVSLLMYQEAYSYCIPTVTGSSGSNGIINVTLEGMNNSTPTQEGYRDFFATDSVVLAYGANYVISISVAAPSEDTRVWIDWNQDGDFGDLGEQYSIIRIWPGSPGLYNITVPPTAPTGITRMRISGNTSTTSVDSCLQADGDIEDYKIIVQDKNMSYYSSRQLEQYTCISGSQTNVPIIGIEIETRFLLNPINVDTFEFSTLGTTNLGDISNAKLWHTSNSNVFSTGNQFGNTVTNPVGSFLIIGSQILLNGTNYFWLTYDVNGTSSNIIKGSTVRIVVDDTSRTPDISLPTSNISIEGVGLYPEPTIHKWYFGENAGLNFCCSPPTPLLDGAMNAFEGCASIADNNAKLLFYTNGEAIWDSKHDTMPNGRGLLGNKSSGNAAIITPVIGQQSQYYVFTTDAVENTYDNGLTYNKVDMTLPGNGTVANPLGDVMPGFKNIQLQPKVFEMLTAVRHANGIDYWVVVKSSLSSLWSAYLVTCDSVSTIPVNSSLGGFFNSYLVASHDGKMLSTDNNVFDFDNCSGVVSNRRTVNGTAAIFSPNDSIIYKTGTGIFVYQRYAANIQATQRTETVSGFLRALELGPDGKIYIPSSNSSYMPVINNPNSYFFPNIIDSMVFLGGRKAKLGLPHFYDKLTKGNPVFYAGLDDTICYGDSITLGIDSLCGLAYSWSPATSLNSTSIARPIAKPLQTTIYILTVTSGCESRQDSVIIWVEPLPVAVWQDSSVCALDSILLDAGNPGSSYLWSTSNTTQNIAVQNSGIYWVEITSPQGCFNRDSISVVFNPLPNVIAGNDTAICFGETLRLVVNGANTYMWLPASSLNNPSTNNPIATPQDTTAYIVFGTDTLTKCTGNDTTIVNIIPLPIIDLQDTFSLCTGTSLLINAEHFSISKYLWSTSDTTKMITIDAIGKYWLQAEKNTCVSFHNFEVLPCPVIYIPNAFSPNGDGKNDFFTIEGERIDQLSLSIYNRWGVKVFESIETTPLWNGTHNGKGLMAGVYVYYLTGLFTNGKLIEQKGNITLLK